jgi:hypothetical protein
VVAHRARRHSRSTHGWPVRPEPAPRRPWPYILLDCGYATLAIGLLIVGAQRQRELDHALRTGDEAPLRFRTVGLFTVGGIALAVVTVVLVITQT